MISWSDAIKYANLVKIAEPVEGRMDYSARDRLDIIRMHQLTTYLSLMGKQAKA